MRDPDITCPMERSQTHYKSFGIRDTEGCYAAFTKEGTCLYVGMSGQLLTRIMRHYIDQDDGNGIQWRLSGLVEWYWKRDFAPPGSILKVWKTTQYRERHRLERELIHALKPSFNGILYKYMNSPVGEQLVVAELASGRLSYGVICGESRDKECWRIRLDGRGKNSLESFHKTRCTLLSKPRSAYYEDPNEALNHMEEQAV